MTMVHGKLKHEDLNKLLTYMAEGLHARGKTMDVYIYGGAAFMLGDQIARETTSDIDVHVEGFDNITALQELRREIAPKEDVQIRPTFLGVNTGASLERLVQRRDEYFTPALPGMASKGLRIYLLNPEAQLALKLSSMRSADYDDIQKLLTKLEINSRAELLDLWSKYGFLVEKNARKLVEMDTRVEKNVAQIPFNQASVRPRAQNQQPKTAQTRSSARKLKLQTSQPR